MSSQSRQIQTRIAAYAQKASKANPGISKDQFIDRVYIDRFLNRIFSDATDTDWVLKGGTGIIARVPLGRRTTDIDLFTAGYSLDDAQRRLIKLSEIDLGDGFTIEFIKETELIDPEQQTTVELKRLTFNVNTDGLTKRTLSIDLAVGPSPIGEIVIEVPKERLEIPEFKSFPYRLYPIEHQTAEKVCATFAKYGNGFSSREKDLVDLVVIATQSLLDGETLHRAIAFETNRRELNKIFEFSVPEGWGNGYIAESKKAPACAKYPTISDALNLMKKFIDPALKVDHSGEWDPESLEWTN